jgi:hypothetical protein
MDRWWLYWRRRGELHDAIDGLERIIVITRVSKTVVPLLVPTGQVVSERIAVFASDDPGFLSLLSSAPHYWWAIEHSATMKADLNYSPTDAFENFVRPKLTSGMRELGELLDIRRCETMFALGGLTATYNLIHDATCTGDGIVELREIHRAIDEEVARAYGWHDLVEQPGGLGHGFHKTRQGPRYTVGPAVRQEILDRLLEENHQRYQTEVDAGLHDKKKAKGGTSQVAKRAARARPLTEDPPGLF